MAPARKGRFSVTWLQKSHSQGSPRLLERHKAAIYSCRLDSGDRRMGSEAPETLPVVRCPGCEEPMQPKGSARHQLRVPEVERGDEAHDEAGVTASGPEPARPRTCCIRSSPRRPSRLES